VRIPISELKAYLEEKLAYETPVFQHPDTEIRNRAGFPALFFSTEKSVVMRGTVPYNGHGIC